MLEPANFAMARPTFARFEQWKVYPNLNFDEVTRYNLDDSAWGENFSHKGLGHNTGHSFIIPDKENRQFFVFSKDEALKALSTLIKTKTLNAAASPFFNKPYKILKQNKGAKKAFETAWQELQTLIKQNPNQVLSVLSPLINSWANERKKYTHKTSVIKNRGEFFANTIHKAFIYQDNRKS